MRVINETLKDNKNCIFFGKFNKSCLITYTGIIFAILAMYFSFINIALVDKSYIRYALACLVLSGICDMYDGKFARLCKRTQEEKKFGVQIDSLADTICFIITPIVIMFGMGMQQWYYLIAYTILAICGVSRLGYFNIQADTENAIKTYKGLPVTSTAIIYPAVELISASVTLNVLSWIYFVTTIITGIFFVLNIKISKWKGVAYLIVPILAAILIVLLMVF